MKRNPLRKLLFVAFALLVSSAMADVHYPFVDTFEDPPSHYTRWELDATDGVSSWSVTHAASGAYSIYLERTAESHSYAVPKLRGAVDGVPQTGMVEVTFSFYFDSIDTSNVGHILTLGSPNGDGYSGLAVGIFAAGAHTSELATYNPTQGGWNYGTNLVLQVGTWYHGRILINQDTNKYTFFITVGNGTEQTYVSDQNMFSTKFGAAGNNYIMSFPFVKNRYYIDDIRVSSPGVVPVELSSFEVE